MSSTKELIKTIRDCMDSQFIQEFTDATIETLGQAADKLENMLSAEAKLISEITRLRAFKAYFDELYGTGLEVANWHENGELETFDSFYDAAVEEMERES